MRDDFGKYRMYMGLTILCGLIFLVVKYFEYSAKFEHHRCAAAVDRELEVIGTAEKCAQIAGCRVCVRRDRSCDSPVIHRDDGSVAGPRQNVPSDVRNEIAESVDAQHLALDAVGDQQARAGRGRERHADQQLRVVGDARALGRVGPAPVEHELALAVLLQVERHGCDQPPVLARDQPQVRKEHGLAALIAGALHQVQGLQVIGPRTLPLAGIGAEITQIRQGRADPPFVAQNFLQLQDLLVIGLRLFAPAAHRADVAEIPQRRRQRPPVAAQPIALQRFRIAEIGLGVIAM